MNIINIENSILEKQLDSTIFLKQAKKNIIINIINNTSLCINLLSKEDINLEINLNDNVEAKIFLMSKLENNNLNSFIVLKNNSNLLFNHFSINDNINDTKEINMNGLSSKIEYYYSCKGNTKQKLNVYHNSSKTDSLVSSNGISNNEHIIFEITEKVPKKVIGCNLNQKSRIINLKDNISTIKPILLIDEQDVTASHSSVISPINDKELFYLMSRGISKEESINLLTTGFLVNNLKLTKEEKHLLFEKYIFRR